MFVNLLPEIQTKILAYCCVDDILNLALTCSACNSTLKEHFFQTLEIPLDEILNYELSENDRSDLRYVSVLRVVTGRPRNLRRGDATEEGCLSKKENLMQLEGILEHCSLEVLEFKCYNSFPVKLEFDVTEDMVTLFKEKCPNLKTLKLDCFSVADDILAQLTSLQSLTELSLSFCHSITDLGLKMIAELTSLKKLDISSNNELSDKGMSYLCSLTGLEELDISGCHGLTDRSLKCISAAMLSLRHFCAASVWNVTDAGLFHLTKLPALQELHLGGLDATENMSLSYITQLKSSLKTLDIRSWEKVTVTDIIPYMALLCNLEELLLGPNSNFARTDLHDLSFLFKMQQLTKLDLNFCNVTDDAFSHLRVLPLHELAVCIESDAALFHVSHIASLCRLDIRKSNTAWGFSDIGLSYLKNIPSLQVLRFRNHKLSQVMMSHIGNLVTLRKLSIRGDFSVNDLGLLNLRRLAALRELDMSGNRLVTDTGLQYISVLKQLKWLNIGNCPQLTDIGLSHLVKLPLLRVLAISLGNRKYSDECIRSIKNLKLVHSDYFGHTSRL